MRSPLLEAAENLLYTISTLSDIELERLLDECRETSETNCSWAVYKMAQVMEPVASQEFSDREKRRLSATSHSDALQDGQEKSE